MRTILKTICTCALVTLGSVWAQDAQTAGKDSLRGHWTGSIALPNQASGIEIDIDKPGKEWIGTLAIPERNQSGVPLSNFSFAEGKWSFGVTGAPGAPTFTATLSADGKEMSGDFSAGGGVFPMKATRNGDPKIEAPRSSPAVDTAFTGVWEGAIEPAGNILHLKLKISNGPNGSTAVLTTIDQGNADLAVSSIEQAGTKLDLKVAMVGGEYRAEINKEGTELTGTWSQGPGTLPLVMKKAK